MLKQNKFARFFSPSDVDVTLLRYQWTDMYITPRVNHLTHLSHSVLLHGQKDSFFTHFWVILSLYWPTMVQMSQMIHLGFSSFYVPSLVFILKYLFMFSFYRGKLGEWRTMGNGEQRNDLVEGVKVIKCFHPRMLTPPMVRVNTNQMEPSYHSLSWHLQKSLFEKN